MELATKSRLLLDRLKERAREVEQRQERLMPGTQGPTGEKTEFLPIPVKNEIDAAKKYLALEALRLDNRLTVNWDIDKFPRTPNMPVPTPQPILENAIRHGIEEKASGGMVDVRLWGENDQIHIQVTNPGPKVRARQEKSTPGQSLDNIRQRFQSHYSGQASLISVEEDGRFTVTVVLPTRGGNP